MTPLLLVLAFAFAWSMGAHYTGACMGMPRALGAIGTWPALLLMAPLTLVGATFASHGVEQTVGHGLTHDALSRGEQATAIAVAFALTTLFNRLRLPTSTIQILVFAVVGTALGVGAGVRWGTVERLVVVWAAAPPAAFAVGFGLTRALDRLPELVGRRGLGAALVAVGGAASFAMGANDVANATGALVGTHVFTPLEAGAFGGAGLALGVLTWGRPLLRRVAFEIVAVDRAMATAAQLVQAAVVLAAVAFGYFTSMNQALVGAMAGTGAARGRETVRAETLRGILRGWVVGPAASLALAYALALLVR